MSKKTIKVVAQVIALVDKITEVQAYCKQSLHRPAWKRAA